jgi:transcriptional regulator with XRE-family HTH domain
VVRAQAQAKGAGLSIREARIIGGMTRGAAAARAGMARSTWDRIEKGRPSVTFANLVAAADAVGLDVVCTTYPGRPPGLRDSGQLAVAQRLRALAADAWQVTLEERAGEHGEAIDLLFRGPSEILAVEIERAILDWQAQFRRWSMKRDWLAARHARPVRLVVVVADTQRNRTALTPFAPLIGGSMPAGSRAVLHALRAGTPLGSDGLCWLRESGRQRARADR